MKYIISIAMLAACGFIHSLSLPQYFMYFVLAATGLCIMSIFTVFPNADSRTKDLYEDHVLCLGTLARISEECGDENIKKLADSCVRKSPMLKVLEQ